MFTKDEAQPLLENKIYEASYYQNYQNLKGKTIKIYPTQHAGLLKFFFTEDSLKIKKDLGLVPRPNYFYQFLVKTFLL